MAPWTACILLLPLLFLEVSKAQDCGKAPLNNKVVGGADATNGTWPWQVSIHYNPVRNHICGGTLINNQWVLTAAHCMISMIPGDWTLYLGRQAQVGFNPNEVRRFVSQIIVHPQYNDTLYNNDIALMKLNTSVSFTDYIRPICLADNSSVFHNATLCWATGWGNIGKGVALGSPQNLQEVEVPVVGSNQCICQYKPAEEANITSKMICAGRENKGICQGDSGGPLQCKEGAVWIQAGISSFGVPCALADFPEVYTRVSEFQTWITNNVAGASLGLNTFMSSGTDTDSSFVCPNNTILSTTAGTPNATTAATPNATTAATPAATQPSSASGAQHKLFLLIPTMLLSCVFFYGLI